MDIADNDRYISSYQHLGSPMQWIFHEGNLCGAAFYGKKAAYVKMAKSHERTWYEVLIQFGSKYVRTVAFILCGVVGE